MLVKEMIFANRYFPIQFKSLAFQIETLSLKF